MPPGVEDFKEWNEQFEHDLVGEPLEVDDRRSAALGAVIIHGGVQKPVVEPVVVLDLGSSPQAQPGASMTQQLLLLGLAPVVGFDRQFHPNFEWFYTVQTGRTDTDCRIRITARSQPEIVVYEGPLTTRPDWLQLEAQLKTVLLIVGDFSLAALLHGKYTQKRLQQLIEDSIFAHQALGAAIRRAGNTRRAEVR